MGEATGASRLSLLSCEEGCGPVEDRLRASLHNTMEGVFDEDLTAFPGQMQYDRTQDAVKGCCHGRRQRQIPAPWAPPRVSVTRVRLLDGEGSSSQWRSRAHRPYQRLTEQAEACIAAAYLAGASTRRVKRALWARFKGAVSKDTVKPCLAQGKGNWEAWRSRSLADERRSCAEYWMAPSQVTAVEEGHHYLGAGCHRWATGWAEGSSSHRQRCTHHPPG